MTRWRHCAALTAISAVLLACTEVRDVDREPVATSGADDGSNGTGVPGMRFDVPGVPDIGSPPADLCHVVDDMDAVGHCEDRAPPDSFEPDVQWTWGQGQRSWVTPLVANLTDDNADGAVDLCDVPDIVLIAEEELAYGEVCRVHVLDGASGAEHYEIGPEAGVSCTATPALGDIDGDGVAEIVAIWNDAGVFRVVAFAPDGSELWRNTSDGDEDDQFARESGALALHDLDADGDVEVVFNHEVYDHTGALLWRHDNPDPGELEATTAADLDGDGLLEVITGHAAYRVDGSVYYEKYPTVSAKAIPQIGNLDTDPHPEVLLTTANGIWVLEHDGTVKYGPVTPTGVAPEGYLTWQRPATIHDFDGDLLSDFATSSATAYAVFQGPTQNQILWQVTVADLSGAAGSTAFDFLGDGIAEAMYADETAFRIYDGKTGAVQLEIRRGSPTISEYPVVADVDNDGSAEILVVSTSGEPALQVIRDQQDRWIQARRIWNQHAYYVTNVREDGTIPQHVAPSWRALNTFRTNAQIESGGICMPIPTG